MKKKLRIALALALLCVTAASCALAACPTEEAHRYGPWKTKTTATCTRQGHQFRYCQRCDHWEQRRTPKLPHTPGELTVTKAPTCTETGKQEGVCTVCENTVRYTMDKLPHAYGDLKESKAPTCTHSGAGKRVCADCGREKTETIDRLGHSWGEMAVTKAPTCQKAGTGEEICLRCGQAQRKTIDKLAHEYGEWTVTQEPEGKKKGVRERVCALCGEKKTDRFYAEGTLYQDMEPCEDVIRLQERLRDLGYYNGSISSGNFGKLTATAVSRFQRDQGMEESGLADPATFDAITAAWEKATGKTAVDTLNAEEMEAAQTAQPIE